MSSRPLLFIAVVILSFVAIGENATDATTLIRDGIRLEQSGDIDGALVAYKKVAVLAPSDYRTMNTIAGLYGGQGKFQDEVRWSDKSRQLKPSYMPAWINYGNGELALGNVDEANASYEKANELAPLDPSPVYSLGVVQEQKQHFEAALALYQKSIELNPKFENGYYNSAAMLANLGRNSEARVTLRKLLVLNPKAEDAKRMLGRLESVSRSN